MKTKTQKKTPTYTLSSVAAQLNLSPKVVRAKFRRLAEDAPFDHTKVKQLTPAQVKAAKEFLQTDFRTAAE